MKKCKHKLGPIGYAARLQWIAKMSNRYEQTQCPKCGLWSIWKKRKSNKNIIKFKVIWIGDQLKSQHAGKKRGVPPDEDTIYSSRPASKLEQIFCRPTLGKTQGIEWWVEVGGEGGFGSMESAEDTDH